MARMPRNQLLDLLFGAFRDQQFWRLQDLRQKTQQPEAYLKEVLSEIATLHRSGDHSSMWELKAGIGFEDPNAQGGSSQTAGLYQMKAEDYAAEDDDDEDEEDEDMEEVT
jgi:transcription initiation factor TFIIF subunit beta